MPQTSASNLSPNDFLVRMDRNHAAMHPLLSAQALLATTGLPSEGTAFIDRVLNSLNPLKNLAAIEKCVFDYTVNFQACRDALKSVPKMVAHITQSSKPAVSPADVAAHRDSIRHRLQRLHNLKNGNLLKQTLKTQKELERLLKFVEAKKMDAEKIRRVSMCIGRMKMAAHELECELPATVEKIAQKVYEQFPAVADAGWKPVQLGEVVDDEDGLLQETSRLIQTILDAHRA